MYNQTKSPVRYWGIESTDRIQSLLKPVVNFAASFGLEPFNLIVTKVIGDSTLSLKKKLQDESRQLFFAVRKEITKSDIDNFISEIRGSKKYSSSSLARYRKVFEDSINSKNEYGITWAEKQAQAGFAILMASLHLMDATATIDDKIDRKLCDNVLGLEKEGYTSIVLIQIKFNHNRDFVKDRIGKRKLAFI